MIGLWTQNILPLQFFDITWILLKLLHSNFAK
jgi:hypothetical protein